MQAGLKEQNPGKKRSTQSELLIHTSFFPEYISQTALWETRTQQEMAVLTDRGDKC